MMKEKLQRVTLKKSGSWPATMNSPEVDLFTMDGNPSPEQQREFEIFWKKMTGRDCIVVPTGVEFKGTFKYPEIEG